jgi:hypothetical protein
MSNMLLVKFVGEKGLILQTRYKKSLNKPGRAKLNDIQVKNVEHIVKAYQSASVHKIKLPVSGIASGNYILEFRANNVFLLKKYICQDDCIVN